MSNPVMEFTTKEWIEITPSTSRVRVTIKARPPVAANAAFIVFSRPIEAAGGKEAPWQKIHEGMVDNMPQTPQTSELSFNVSPGNYYSFRQQGQAHVLFPGYEEISVGFSVAADNETVYDYGGVHTKEGRAADIIGLTYLEYKNGA